MAWFCEAVVYFFLFSFCGWVCESVFCTINEKKLVNRGFLNGPFCPVYGFGGLIVVYLLAPVRENIVALFLLGTLATSALEYATSFLLEKLFHTSWWDYSDLPFNLNGRVCLQFSLIFGLLSIIAVRVLYDPFHALVEWLTPTAKVWIAWVGIALFCIDAGVTVQSILVLNGKLEEWKKHTAELREKLEAAQGGSRLTIGQRLEQYREDKAERTAAFRENMDRLSQRLEQSLFNRFHRLQHRRLMKAFPRMRSTRHQEQLLELKELLVSLKNRKKEKK